MCLWQAKNGSCAPPAAAAAAAAGDAGDPTRLPPATLPPKRPLAPLGSGGPQMLGARLGMPMGRLCVFPCSG